MSNFQTTQTSKSEHRIHKKAFDDLYKKIISNILTSEDIQSRKILISKADTQLKELSKKNTPDSIIVNNYINSKKESPHNSNDSVILPQKSAYKLVQELVVVDNGCIKLKGADLEIETNDKIASLSKMNYKFSKSKDYGNYTFIEADSNAREALFDLIIKHPVLKSFIVTGMPTYNGLILFTTPQRPVNEVNTSSKVSNSPKKNKKTKNTAVDFSSYFNNIEDVLFH